MAVTAGQITTTFFLVLLQAFLALGGETCISFYEGVYTYDYCEYGCCGEDKSVCCSFKPVGLIVGLACVGFIVVAVIVLLCICCRRRTAGTVIGRPQMNAVVVSSTSVSTTNGVMNTSQIQPGYAYPPPSGPNAYTPQPPRTGLSGPPSNPGLYHEPPSAYPYTASASGSVLSEFETSDQKKLLSMNK